MEHDSLISICIPTRNNADYLKESLDSLAPQAKPYGIPIYVSDNASTDNTLEMLSSFKKEVYPLLYFRSNKRNLGFDQNLVSAVTMASSKYVWPLGDRRRLLPNSLRRVHDLLSRNDLSLLLLSLDAQTASTQNKRYDSARDVFLNLYSNAGTMGFFVLPLEAWKLELLKKYIGTGWIHFVAVFEYLAGLKNVKVILVGGPSIASSGKSTWTKDFFSVWSNWKSVINELPSVYSKQDKESIIRAWTIDRSISILLYLRAAGVYNSDVYEAHEQDFLKYTHIPLIQAKVVSQLPVLLFKPYPFLRSAMSKVSRMTVQKHRVH
jgi:glycosyltransferase involved in cell wall biosynthesis